jgi:hypothetical protein
MGSDTFLKLASSWIRELLRPSRYKRDPDGALRAVGEAPGGSPGNGLTTSAEGGGPRGSRGGRSSDDYLADLVESGGEPASAVVI